MRVSRLPNVLTTCAIFLLGFFLLHGCDAAVLQKDYDYVIASTKGHLSAAQLAPAIEQLRQWHAVEPLNQLMTVDLMTLLDKAGDYSAAVELAPQVNLTSAPNYAINTAAHAFLKTGNFKLAETNYQLLLSKIPADIDAQVGLVYAWMGQQRLQEALDYAQQHVLPAQGTPSPEQQATKLPMVIALAELYELRHDWLQASSTYHKALQLNPEFRYAQRGLVYALNAAGLIHLANDSVKRYRDVFSNDELYHFAQSDSAVTIRYGKAQLDADRTHSRFNTTDIALTENTLLTQQFGESNKTKFDRIIALDDRCYMREAVQVYLSLVDAKVVVPSYVKSAVADAYLYLEQPEQARDLYLDVIHNWDPANEAGLVDIQFQLISAYSDAGQYRQAEELIKQILEHQAQLNKREKNDKRPISYNYLNALEVDATLQKNEDHLDHAETQLSVLRAKAPFNNAIRANWASLLSARNHPRAALDEYSLMLIDQPASLDATLGRAESLLSLNEFDQSKSILPALLDNNPENKSVQNLARRIATYDQALYHIETTLGHGAAQSGADSLSSAIVYTAPLLLIPEQDPNQPGTSDWSSNHLRLFAHIERSSGENVNNVPAFRSRAGVGMDYRAQDITAEAEINQTLNKIDNVGIVMALSWDISDSWYTRASVDTNVIDLAAAAMLLGITAKEVKIAADWNENESRKAGAELSDTHYSDDNNRHAVYVWWMQRWMSEPVYKVDTVLGVSSSTNSLLNRAYFNPVQDKEFDLDIKGDWVSWHHYQRSFRQRIDIALGRYWQSAYAPGSVAGLRYENEWDFENEFAFTYGAGRTLHPYDGNRSFRNYIYLNLSGRIK